MILAMFVDALVIFLIVSIAKSYYRFWHIFMQCDEPFTRWFSRIAQAFPWFWWPLQIILLIGAGVVAIITPWYWAILGVIGVGFQSWLIPHLCSYISDHQADNPPYKLFFLRYRR